MTELEEGFDPVYCDFEYADEGKRPLLGCFWRIVTNERISVDLRDDAGRRRLRRLYAHWRDCVWISYSASAEMKQFLELDLDIRPMSWIDLFAEARQVTGTHRHFFSRKAGLLFALEAFGITSGVTVAEKETARHLILTVKDHTEEEFARITAYCWTDIDPLPELLQAIVAVHHMVGQPWHVETAIFRAEFLKAQTRLEHRSKGFPVDVALMDRIFSNQPVIRNALARWCNEAYDCDLFRYHKSGPNADTYSFHFAALEKHIDGLPFPVRWERTPTGRLRMDAEYLPAFAKQNEHFKPLQTTKSTLDQLKTGDLRSQVQDGFIAGASISYYTRTGRSQPLTSRGFLLNLPPWMRYTMRAPPGYTIIAVDYVQQEIVIAAALTGDVALAEALATGDTYLAMAKLSGSVPQEANKATHAVERQVWKSAVLGISYGMGYESLGLRIFLDLRDRDIPAELSECVERARAIIAWHKATYKSYWDYIAREVAIAQQCGWIRACDGWTMFVDAQTRFTQLQNFKFQANGAVMLREAIKVLDQHEEIRLIATLHDATYVLCRDEDVVEHERIVRVAMAEGARRVLHDAPLPIEIALETNLYPHSTGYTSPKGKEMFDRIMGLLDHEGV